MNLEDIEERGFAREDPKGFLRRHHSGVILDEIQNVPDLPSWLQVHVDETGEPGQFVLTGSRQFEVMEVVSQSLAGRTAMLKLLPFSIDELRAGGRIRGNDDLIHRGFYTRIYSSGLDSNRVFSDYLSTYVERYVRQLSQIHNMSLFERCISLCAVWVGQILNFSSLANDTGISHTTASEWMKLLQAGATLNSDYFRGLKYFLERVAGRNPYTVSAGLLVYNGDRVVLRKRHTDYSSRRALFGHVGARKIAVY